MLRRFLETFQQKTKTRDLAQLFSIHCFILDLNEKLLHQKSYLLI